MSRNETSQAHNGAKQDYQSRKNILVMLTTNAPPVPSSLEGEG